MATELKSIDLVLQPCYFKIFLVDIYGRSIDINTIRTELFIRDVEEIIAPQNLKFVQENDLPSLNGLCVWMEDLERIFITDGNVCIQDTTIEITPDDYLIGENKTVIVEYNNAINQLPGNPYNYVRWNIASGTVAYPFAGTSPTTYLERAIECTGCKVMPEYIANPYLRNCQNYKPTMTSCDETNFYFNSENGIDSATFSTLRLDIIDTDWNTIQTDIAIVKLNVVSGPNVNFYVEGLKLTGLVPCKTYKLVVYDPVGNKAIAISNEFIYMEDEDLINELTSYVEYKASQNMYYFDYDGLPNFKNKIRLNLHRMGWNPENITDVYEEDTTGIVRNYFSTPKKYFEVRTYYFDDRAHESTVVLLEHDEIEVNTIQYTVKTKHSLENDPIRDTHNGSFELYESRFSRINKSC